jgi:hypothetical protein
MSLDIKERIDMKHSNIAWRNAAAILFGAIIGFIWYILMGVIVVAILRTVRPDSRFLIAACDIVPVAFSAILLGFIVPLVLRLPATLALASVIVTYGVSDVGVVLWMHANRPEAFPPGPSVEWIAAKLLATIGAIIAGTVIGLIIFRRWSGANHE